MLPARFLEILKFRLAEIAVGPSALRNQGAPGVIAAARCFLKVLDLGSFVVSEESDFLSRLDEETTALQAVLPAGTQHWGGARKALNLFLRDALYCSDMASHYRLQAIRTWLEVPLDRYVAQGLRRYQHLSADLPRWVGIKHLRPQESCQYQRVASAVAREEGVARVDLDVIFWRAEMVQPAAAL
jgi:hypothetical protein